MKDEEIKEFAATLIELAHQRNPFKACDEIAARVREAIDAAVREAADERDEWRERFEVLGSATPSARKEGDMWITEIRSGNWVCWRARPDAYEVMAECATARAAVDVLRSARTPKEGGSRDE